jgi:hypothetical protein
MGAHCPSYRNLRPLQFAVQGSRNGYETSCGRARESPGPIHWASARPRVSTRDSCQRDCKPFFLVLQCAVAVLRNSELQEISRNVYVFGLTSFMNDTAVRWLTGSCQRSWFRLVRDSPRWESLKGFRRALSPSPNCALHIFVFYGRNFLSPKARGQTKAKHLIPVGAGGCWRTDGDPLAFRSRPT